MKTYLRILSFARPIGSIVPIYALLVVLSIVFSLASFSFLAPVLNVLFSASTQQGARPTAPGSFELSYHYISQFVDYWKYALTQGEPVDALGRICTILLVSVFASSFFGFLSQALLAVVKSRVIRNIQQRLYQKINALHLSYFTDERKGDIMSRMTNDVQEVESTAVNAFNVLLKEPLTVVIIICALFYYSASLTYFTLIILPVSGLVIGQLTRKLRKNAKRSQSLLSRILGMIDETLGGMRVVKGFTAEKYMEGKFNQHTSDYADTLKWMDYKRSLSSPLSQFLGMAVVAGVLYYGGKLVLEKNDGLGLKPEDFLVYILLYANIISPLKSISTAFSNIQRGLISADRIFAVLDTPNKISDLPDAVSFEAFEQQIEFKNVSFGYSPGVDVLKNISLTIPAGQTVAIVGPSGGGKSTLLDLIPRYHDVSQGQICMDGLPIKNFTTESLRKQLGIVTQESILFNDTIHNNIAFGIEAKPEDVERAARIANAHEFIVGLENGYQTEIGDGGNKLSGGQRQRLTIARAILKNPPILLLDEATSALDSESEHLVQDALDKLMKDRTSLVIAHRFSTIKSADLIVVIKEGEVVEQGTHQELVQKDGLYRRLNAMQTV